MLEKQITATGQNVHQVNDSFDHITSLWKTNDKDLYLSLSPSLYTRMHTLSLYLL